MAKIFIIHGTLGNPNENWIPWLRKELENRGHKVIAPTFPTPKNQSLENWSDIFSEYKYLIDENTIFIGHSLAPAFILNILEHLDIQVKASYLISGFLRLLGIEPFDTVNKTFIKKDFDWKKIRKNCKQFFVYHSDNDPYVPIECAQELSEKLKIKPIIIHNAGHFNENAGYTKFERLLDDVIKNV